MTWQRSSTAGAPPPDPVADAVAETLLEVLPRATVELAYAPAGTANGSRDAPEPSGRWAAATGEGPKGWDLTVVVRLGERRATLTEPPALLDELLATLPEAALRVAGRLRPHGDGDGPVGVLVRRALRDAVAAAILSRYAAQRLADRDVTSLLESTIEFLVELGSTRVEARDLTHGVVITDVFHDAPRLRVPYPGGVRAAKRAPLLFDGQRAVLVVDPEGRARTELQRHRLERLAGGPVDGAGSRELAESGSLVAAATGLVGGLGLFLRADRSIWTFVDGQPLLVRRGERWAAFPLALRGSLARMIGGGKAAAIIAQAAFMISAQARGAILAIVDDPAVLDGIVSRKDRYDLRDESDPAAMRVETRLHHLIDVEDLDEHTLVRLATLDGATILDRDGRLLAYGAIVSSSDSQHEGARTAAARTLSERAELVLMVSVDGDITIFRDGAALRTVLGRGTGRPI